MQEVTSVTSSLGTSFDQMRSSALVDVSSQSRAFSDFMGIVSQPKVTTSVSASAATATSASATTAANSAAGTVAGTVAGTTATATNTVDTAATALGTDAQALLSQINATPDVAPVQPLVQTDTASTLATTTSATTASTRVVPSSSTSTTTSSAAKNTTVSRTAFEESKGLLTKAGLSSTEISDLSSRVQAGTLTWGQLVQTIGAHTTGAKKTVSLSASETADLQSMFQKMGFASTQATEMVKSVSQGDGLKVLSTIQNSLSTQADDTSLNFSTSELSTLFKALRLPTATSTSLTQKLASESATVADVKNALNTMSQAMQDQRTKTAASDTEVAKGLAKIMDKDVAKAQRDSTASTETTTGSSGGKVTYDLKTKDKNDTSWFDDHEKTTQKSSDESWRNFLSKVRSDDTSSQQNSTGSGSGSSTGTGTGTGTGANAHATAQTSAKESLEAAINRSAQAATTTQGTSTGTQQTKAYEQVTAPKVLDQVTQAMLKDLGQGRKQLTVELDPENLGKVQVMLQVKGKEVSAVISAEDSSTAAMLTSNMDSLKKTLEDQGLTVQNMEVQTGLASRQDQQAAFNAEQHNQAQEQQDMSRIFSQLRMMRTDSGDAALDMQNSDMQAILSDQGLHLIA